MNLSRIASKYIREHPSVSDCLSRGLINYSALAREICEAEGLRSFDAVLVACRRHYARSKVAAAHEKKILSLIQQAKVRVRNKIAVAIVEKSRSYEKTFGLQDLVRAQRGDFNLIEGEDTFIVVTNSNFVADIKEFFGARVKKITSNLVQITMLFDKKLETTAGVVAHLYRLFAENNINILEEMSCWTDVMIIIDEKDLPRAMDVLTPKIP